MIMNKRIKKLIGQAQKEVWGNNPYNGSPEFEGYELDAEKFAKLIIRECADWIDRQDETRCPYGIDLVEHFGVR
jgi:hypothetical protein